MDELRNAIKEKTVRSLDRMVRWTNSPLTIVVLECPVPLKFRLPQLEPFDGLKDPLDHLNTFKMTWVSNSPLTRYYVVPSLPYSKEQPGSGSLSYQHRPSITSSSYAAPSSFTLSMGSAQKDQQTICSTSGKGRKRP